MGLMFKFKFCVLFKFNKLMRYFNKKSGIKFKDSFMKVIK